jgi:hypothetical protein
MKGARKVLTHSLAQHFNPLRKERKSKMREFSTATRPQTTGRELTLIERQTPTPDFTRAVIVNREQLAGALRDARHVSGVLHNIENLDDLSWEEMTDLCRTAYSTARALARMLEAKEVNAQ